METELAKHLELLVESFGRARGLTASTIGKMSAADGRFFARIRDGKTFTIRKYDDLIQWFSDNWPDNAEWPEDVSRPSARDTQEAAE